MTHLWHIVHFVIDMKLIRVESLATLPLDTQTVTYDFRIRKSSKYEDQTMWTSDFAASVV